MKHRSLYPETAQEALARWDAGESVFTIEMGGLGPGYEQCIHIVAFEIIRAQGDTPLGDEAPKGWGDDVAHRCSLDLGLSGAQVGAAKSLAYHTLRKGWRATLEEVDGERHIQVSKSFPHLTSEARRG